MAYEKKVQLTLRPQVERILKNRGITKTAFADLLGTQKQNVNSLLDDPSSPTMLRIAAALDVPLWQLFVDPEELRTELVGAGGGVQGCTGVGACGAKCPHCGGALNIRVE